MASNSELHLMTKLLNLPGVKVRDYRIIESIGIILSLENTKKEVICPNCEKTTDLLHQNNFLSYSRFILWATIGLFKNKSPSNAMSSLSE